MSENFSSLIKPDAVHRDVYLAAEVFAMEQKRLWRNAWVYLGHESQVSAAGDFYATEIASEPLMMVRRADASVTVLKNRCAHKGTKLVSATHGNVGKFFRCPYHAWTYHLDGRILAIPLKSGYENTGFKDCEATLGLGGVGAMQVYRGFVFVRLAETGIGFHEYFGDSLSSIDNLADRSPEGELEIAGGCLRYLHNCNWKMFVENLNDSMHPMVAHESSAGTAKKLGATLPEGALTPMAIEQFVPFVNDYAFYDKMGVRILNHGHGYSGANYSIHSKYSVIPEYEEAMKQRYGEARAHEILGTVRHNTVYYPSLTIKGAIQTIRVVRPLAADKTLIESWTFRLKGAPAKLLQRTITYNRLINSPMSVVGHDDLHCYRSIQEGLAASGNEWVSLHRNANEPESLAMTSNQPYDLVVNGTSEASMRNQFSAWLKLMNGDGLMNEHGS
jgi:benzoate/toluate 1,2-dioxygenase subunit alpha